MYLLSLSKVFLNEFRGNKSTHIEAIIASIMHYADAKNRSVTAINDEKDYNGIICRYHNI
jgi:hypothetical protein